MRTLIRTVERTLGRQVCRGCGCTDHAACVGGCSWVEPDLCSACVELHPEYLDDDGAEGVSFVRHDLAAYPERAIEWALDNGLFEYEDRPAIDLVWMRPAGEGTRGDDWYEIVDEAVGVVRYWRLSP